MSADLKVLRIPHPNIKSLHFSTTKIKSCYCTDICGHTHTHTHTHTHAHTHAHTHTHTHTRTHTHTHTHTLTNVLQPHTLESTCLQQSRIAKDSTLFEVWVVWGTDINSLSLFISIESTIHETIH